MYLSNSKKKQTTRKQSKIKFKKLKEQTTRKQRKKKSMKSFLLPKQSNKTESKSASETTIDTIISNITKQDISADAKIQMICEKLSHLETIDFHGVLTLPYIKSKVSKGEYDRGQTLGGMMRRETDAQILDSVEKELKKIDKKINTINLDIAKNETKLAETKISAIEADKNVSKASPQDKPKLEKEAATKKQSIKNLESKIVDYNIELSKLENARQALIDKKEQLDANATARENKEAERRRQGERELEHAASAQREVAILNVCLERYRQQHTEFNNLLGQIEASKKEFMDQISSIDSDLDSMSSDIIRSIGTKLDNINKTNYDKRLSDYKIARQRLPQYQNLESKLVDSTNAVNNCKGLIRGLPAAIAPTVFTEENLIKLRCENQFIITDADCNNVFRWVQSGKITKDSGCDILDVWLENTRRMIELEKELFSKGYKGSTYLTDYDIYKKEFDKIDSHKLEQKLNVAFEDSRTRDAHTIVKTKLLSQVDSGFVCLFYSDINKTEAMRASMLPPPHKPRDNFHLTVHLDKGDPTRSEDLPSRNVNKYSSGSIHLTGDHNMYKANMRPYIFVEDTAPAAPAAAAARPPIDGFIGLPRCIQILPVYPGDAASTSEVIYVGRIVTDTLNTYLKELAIDSQMLKEEQAHNSNFHENTYRPIIHKLQIELPKQLKLVKKQKYLAEIKIFEATLAKIKANLLEQIEVFREDDECKTFFANYIKEPYEQIQRTIDKELIKKKDKFKGVDENGMDPAILVEIARQGVNLEDVFPSEFFPEGGHINLRDIAAAAGKYKRKKYTRKRYNKVSKKRRYKILRNRTNKQSIYKIKIKNKQK